MQLQCPQCQSVAYKRNGYTRHGKQNHRCLDCGRQFCFDMPQEKLYEHHLSIIIERIEAEEFWSSGSKKKTKQWMWIALDKHAKKVIAFYVDSDGSKNGAEELWNLVPEEYKQNAIIYTELDEILKGVLPKTQHQRIRRTGEQ